MYKVNASNSITWKEKRYTRNEKMLPSHSSYRWPFHIPKFRKFSEVMIFILTLIFWASFFWFQPFHLCFPLCWPIGIIKGNDQGLHEITFNFKPLTRKTCFRPAASISRKSRGWFLIPPPMVNIAPPTLLSMSSKWCYRSGYLGNYYRYMRHVYKVVTHAY